MNEDAASLEPGELDELLSADIDGELASVAHERGSDVDTLRARIAATPGAVERRAALVAAHDALGEAPELDELVAVRLRTKAVGAARAEARGREASRRERRNRALLTVAGIAAAILVVAGIGVALALNGSSSNAKSSSSASPPAAGPQVDLSQNVPALGSYTDVGALGSVAVNAAQQRAAQRASGSDRVAAGSDNDAAASPTTRSQPAYLQSPQSAGHTETRGTAPPYDYVENGSGGAVTSLAPAKSANKTPAPPASCTPAKFAGPGDHLQLHASATLDGRPVQVYVFSGRGEHTVVVLDRACRLLNVQTLG